MKVTLNNIPVSNQYLTDRQEHLGDIDNTMNYLHHHQNVINDFLFQFIEICKSDNK